jgi:hypothetical protein
MSAVLPRTVPFLAKPMPTFWWQLEALLTGCAPVSTQLRLLTTG